ncbi:YnbE-like lipoprotein [Novosphingobium taihuense]|nr:YnbE-like lipoprotein [Novosphingobium taihuense]
MRSIELTRSANPATIFRMRKSGSQFGRRLLLAAPLVLGLATGGCISVKAPDKPIVIELNINIKQEVVYRLAQDANNTIESNPDIF